jgi:hypothetical protein
VVPQERGELSITPQALIVLLIVVALPVAWFASEFGERRRLRIVLGIAAIGAAMGGACVFGYLSRLNYNAWYGRASKELVETAVTQIEDGNSDRVMSVLRRLNRDYQPTYENRAHYDEPVDDAVSQMKGNDDLHGTKWDMSPFTPDTWHGHWENDTGFWIVIRDTADFDIVRSGDDMPKMTDVVISEDCRSLAFSEGDQWRHELSLRNKYEATHVWRDLKDDSVWQTDTLHRLRRATPQERAFTEQTE